MGVQRRVNWISQQRVDVPDVRAIESAASNDFDQLIQALITSNGEGYILRGFDLAMAGAIGGAASGLQMNVSSAAILHSLSSQSGTFLVVPNGTSPQTLNSATNTIVDGAFAPNALNYVGLEYERFIDDTTAAQVYIWNPTTNSETTKVAPRAQILRYRIKITTSTWATNVMPVAIVTTDAGNNVTTIQDARRLLLRLGTAGRSTPNPFYSYPWTAQSEGRVENPPVSSSNAVNPFEGGDKMLYTMKDWFDAIMSALKEIKGTTYWYSFNSGGSLASLREDLGNTVITGRGYIAHSATAAGRMNWNYDIFVRVMGSQLSYKLVANPSSTDITLLDDQAAYITLVRDVQIAPNIVFTNGSAIVTSVGAVSWTTPLQAGDFVKLGSDTHAGYYQIQSVDSSSQVTLTENFGGTSTGPAGAIAMYAFGSYQTSPVPSTSRHIYIASRDAVPEGQDVFWLFLRSDNGGVIPRVYIRFLGGEIEQGESEEISDLSSRETLKYIGAPLESSSEPMYVSALNPGSVAEIQTATVGAASTVASNEYFLINSGGNYRRYAVWINKDGTGTQPNVPFVTDYLEWDVTTGQTATQLATSLAALLNGTNAGDFSAAAGVSSVTITNTSAGSCSAAVNFNVGAPFALVVNRAGTGLGNFAIHDGDSLTLAIKELDRAMANLASLLDDPSYDETVDIVASGATPPTSLNGPISSSTDITLPNNSRMGNLPQKYTVGNGALEVYLNGQYLELGEDWAEVGAAGSASNQIQILQDLVVGDVLEFRIDATGGPGGGSGGVGPPGPPGPTGPAGSAGTDAAGGPVAVSTKNSNYSVALGDNVLLANASSGNIIFQLPPAASAVGHLFYFKKIDSTANAMILQANGIEEIDGFNTQQTTVQYESFTLVTDGMAWYII
jgi:hypothetical protein